MSSNSVYDDLAKLLTLQSKLATTQIYNNTFINSKSFGTGYSTRSDDIEHAILTSVDAIRTELTKKLRVIKANRSLNPPYTASFSAQQRANHIAIVDIGVARAFDTIIQFFTRQFLDVYSECDNDQIQYPMLSFLLTLVNRVAFINMVMTGTQDNYTLGLEKILGELKNFPNTEEGKELVAMIGEHWLGDDSGDIPTNPDDDTPNVNVSGDA